jgi:hypothetical protein
VVTDDAIIKSTRQWVLNVIVGLNFCPFAKPVVDNDGVCYQVVREQGLQPCLITLYEAMKQLRTDETVETTLLVFPVGFESFDDYLDLVDVADALLVEEGFEGEFQLASFHPDYCFDGAQYDDAANYTNRSPFPMLHILREASVEKALANVVHPEKIPSRNIDVARETGVTALRALLEACTTD